MDLVHPSQELLDSQVYFERLVILLLYTMPSVPSRCISIKPYQTVLNIEIELLGKKPYVMRCAIWYHLYNLKNVKNNHDSVTFSKVTG